MQTWEKSIARACIETMKRQDKPFDFETVIARSSIIEEGRNLLISENIENQMIRQKLNKKYSHFLFIDHDVGFTKENIEQLLTRDVDIVSGSYRPKHDPGQFVAGYCSDEGRITEYVSATDQGFIMVDWVGGGFVLCKREALETMDYPWFWKQAVKYGNRMMTVGEDVYFCLNARNHAIEVYLDTSCILNHEANRYEVQIDVV